MAASCLAAEVRPAVPCGFIVPTHPGFALSVLLACVCVRGAWGGVTFERGSREHSGQRVVVSSTVAGGGAAIQVRG